MTRISLRLTAAFIALIIVAAPLSPPVQADAQQCEYFVSPAGNNNSPGTRAEPWATIGHASAAARDAQCTIWFEDGLYVGLNQLKRRFETQTTFQAIHPYQVTLEGPGPVLELDGIRNMVFSGFEIRHNGPGADKTVMIMDRNNGSGEPSEYVLFTNNIIHDSYNNDLFKIHDGVRFVTLRGNIFYNQGDSDEHLDINGVTDIVVEQNIFFNDFAGSGRPDLVTSKHFITIKDSNEGVDGQWGSERIRVRSNVFFNWEGGMEAFINVGNDGKSFYEANDVTIENNLLIGNSSESLDAPVSIRGAQNISFINNTVAGDLPSRAYALRSSLTGANLPNRNLFFANNIWSDPTGTMGADKVPNPPDDKFATGNPSDTINLVLNCNLYWNGAHTIPTDGLIAPLSADPRPMVGDPHLPAAAPTIFPRWNGASFPTGNTTIRQEFERLVDAYGRIAPDSPAAAHSDSKFAPDTDILGNPRGKTPDLGAYQASSVGTTVQSLTVNAGPDRIVEQATGAQLVGAAFDDRHPDSALAVRWEEVTGPGTVDFSDGGAPATTARFSDMGVYTLRLTGVSGDLSVADEVQIIVTTPQARIPLVMR